MKERSEYKSRIQKDLKENGVEVYPSAEYEHVDDREINETYRVMTSISIRLKAVHGTSVELMVFD